MRFFLLMPMKNEMSRWLAKMLTWHSWAFDAIAIYDDQSDDGSAQLARSFGNVRVRPDDVPSFLEHEGRFRQAAWDWFEESCNPSEGDWVLLADADEFLVAKGEITTAMYASTIEASQANSVMIEIPEVFQIGLDGTPMVRTDGFWGGIAQPRLVRYLPNGTYRDTKMACGAVPVYATHNPSTVDCGLRLLHYGYAVQADREAKYARYTAHPVGHNPTHVASIMQRGVLSTWRGRHPAVTRG